MSSYRTRLVADAVLLRASVIASPRLNAVSNLRHERSECSCCADAVQDLPSSNELPEELVGKAGAQLQDALSTPFVHRARR